MIFLNGLVNRVVIMQSIITFGVMKLASQQSHIARAIKSQAIVLVANAVHFRLHQCKVEGQCILWIDTLICSIIYF